MRGSEGAVDIRDTARAEFVLLLFLCVFLPWGLIGYLEIVVSMVLVLSAWTIYKIYWCERYVVYAFSLVASFAVSMAYMSFTSARIYVDEIGIEGAERLALVVGSPCFVLAVFAIAYFSPSKNFQYVIQGDRVKIGEWKGNARLEIMLCWAMIIAVIALTVLAVILLRGSLELILCLVLAPLLTVVVLVIGRNKVRGVRVLLSLEKASLIKFTFMDIEEIRRVRSRWLLMRFVKWLGSYKGARAK